MAISTRRQASTTTQSSLSKVQPKDMSNMMEYNTIAFIDQGKGNVFPVDDPTTTTTTTDDLTQFLDLSFTHNETSALPLPTATLFSTTTSTAPAGYSNTGNAFLSSCSSGDALLDSPLGLTASPFDLSSSASSVWSTPALEGDFIDSPLLSGAFGTPELEPLDSSYHNHSYPSLFGAAPGSQWTAVPATMEQPQAAVLVPTELGGSVSPSLMSLDATLPPVVPSTTTTTRPSRKRSASSFSYEQEQEVEMQQQQEAEDKKPQVLSFSKDKFTGTRNTKIKPIDFDAPTLPKNYLLPSATSRKRAPAAIASKLLQSSSGAKRQRRSSTPLDPLPSTGELDPSTLPDELLSAIELKRRQNTLAARRSRMRKAGHLAELQGIIEEREGRIRELEMECERLRALVDEGGK